MNDPTTLSCTLTADRSTDQISGWDHVLSRALEVQRTPRGASVLLPADLTGAVTKLAAAESVCCSFLPMSTRSTTDGLLLEVTSAHDEAIPLILGMVGLDQAEEPAGPVRSAETGKSP